LQHSIPPKTIRENIFDADEIQGREEISRYEPFNSEVRQVEEGESEGLTVHMEYENINQSIETRRKENGIYPDDF